MNKIKNSKKGMLILSLLLLFLIIGAASAADDKISNETISTTTPSTDVVSVDSDEQAGTAEPTLGSSDDANSTLLGSGSNEILGEDNVASFNELDVLIKGVDAGDTLNLESDYAYTVDVDGNYGDGITITKVITIDGCGHTINGNGHKLFNIPVSGVVLKNINIINIAPSSTTATYQGIFDGGIYITADNVNLDNISFKDSDIPLTYDKVKSGSIVNSNFDNVANMNIITFSSQNIKIENNYIKNSYSSRNDAARNSPLYIYFSNNITIRGCVFNNVKRVSGKII